MPVFYFHYSDGRRSYQDEVGLEFGSLEEAYLDVCASIPEAARDLLIKRMDPLSPSYKIADARGRVLLDVPFTDILAPSEWRLPKARRRPYGSPRSAKARDDLALTSFRRMFGSANAGCVLLTPEMKVAEMNEFGARHSHVDADAIRGASIFEIFAELHGEPKKHFDAFMSLAQAGVVSEVKDLPYLVLDAEGRTADGFWTARTWPIFDDDRRFIGFVEWAEPHVAPIHGGKTKVRIVPK